jgi:hypothetical protein
MPTKTSSIVSTIITVILLLLFGTASMFFLLVALNGFSGSEGGPALTTGAVCNGIGIILSAVLAWNLTRWLMNKFNWSSIAAVFVSVMVGFFVGGGFSLVSLFIGIVVADSLWNAR